MHPPPHRFGFTLIELLVVVAIIGILAGFLIPALNHGDRVAKSIKCKSNLRQLGLALQMYVNDGGRYPGGNQPDWVWVIADYLADNSIIADRPQGHPAVRVGSATVFRCPARKSEPYLHVGDPISYGYNFEGYAGRGLGSLAIYIGNQKQYHPTRESDVEVPSDMIALGDGMRRLRQWLIPVDSVIERISSVYDSQLLKDPELFKVVTERHRSARRRHAERINLSFCDGHVEALTLKKAFYDETDDALRKWNRDHEPHRDKWRQALQ